MKHSPILVCAALGLAILSSHAVDVRSVGLKGDGTTDDTSALQQAMGQGGAELVFSPGTYLIGTVDIPSNVTLRGEAGAKIRINTASLHNYDPTVSAKHNYRCVFALKGDNIHLEGLEFDFSLMYADTVEATNRPGALIVGDGRKNIRMTRLISIAPEPAPPIPPAERKRNRYPAAPPNRTRAHLASLRNCEDIVLEYTKARHMTNLLNLYQCKRIWSLYNSAESCNSITYALLGEEFLWHVGNWGRDVRHQCRWWGGNSNDIRRLKPDSEGWGTMNIVKRGTRDTDPGFNRYTAGAFDVFVVNNYGDYGRTLAWGSKARQVIFQGNIGRFMNDYVLGTEGCENVIFDSNIAINGDTAGLACYYWSDKVVMTGNIVLVRDEPIDMNYSWFPDPKQYQGGLVRLHAVGGRPNTVNGAGQVLMSGNLFLNELSDRPRGIRIEAGRDVQITGNKIRNAEIRTKGGSGPLTVRGNDFLMTLPHTSTWLYVSDAVPRAIIANNSFRSTVPLDKRSATEVLIRAHANGANKGSLLRVIEGNIIEGFPLAMHLRAFSPTPDRFIVRNNTVDGIIRFEGLRTAYIANFSENLNLNTLQPVKPEVLLRVPEPLPEPAPLPEDADRAEDGQEADAEAQ